MDVNAEMAEALESSVESPEFNEEEEEEEQEEGESQKDGEESEEESEEDVSDEDEEDEDEEESEQEEVEETPFFSELKQVVRNVHTCHVCWDEFHQPRNPARMLTCGHSFCTRCLLKSLEYTKPVARAVRYLKCPECRKSCPQEVASLPVNFHLMQLLTALSLVKTGDDESVIEGLPNINFSSLGTMIPYNMLTEFSLSDLVQHAKIVLQAMISAIHTNPDNTQNRFMVAVQEESALQNIAAQLEALNTRCHARASLYNSSRYGHIMRHLAPITPAHRENVESMRRTMNEIARRHMGVPDPESEPEEDDDEELSLADESEEEDEEGEEEEVVPTVHLPDIQRLALERDWMRDMVVNRPDTEFISADDEVTEVMVREHLQLAEEDEVGRSIGILRNAVLRRERLNAQNQQQLDEMQRIIDRAPPIVRPRLNSTQVAAIERHVEFVTRQDRRNKLERDIKVYVQQKYEEEVEQVQENPQARGRMTRGEAVSILNIVRSASGNSVVANGDVPSELRNFPFHLESIDEVIAHVTPDGASPDEMLRPEDIRAIRTFAMAYSVQMDDMLNVLRSHISTPSLPTIPAPSGSHDDLNARMTIIRKRANEALQGKTPAAPGNSTEEVMTATMLVNLAVSLGVKDKLEELCFTMKKNADFGPVIGKKELIYCKLCQCTVPISAKQSHIKGKTHKNKSENRY